MKKILLIAFLVGAFFAKAQYSKVLDFNSSNGANPNGKLYYDGTYLYGMTQYGGTNNYGLAFKIKPDGTSFDTLLNFRGTNGSHPLGSLISDGTYLYGMTYDGGLNNYGVVFKIKTDGTDFDTLLNFNGTNGANPLLESLFLDSTYLYGTTFGDGSNNNGGNIFKIKIDGTSYVDLHDFHSGSGGAFPHGTLISDGTYLYGTVQQGGLNNDGVIFKIKLDGTSYTKLHDCIDDAEKAPSASLLSDGTYLYGTTTPFYGTATNNNGIIFKMKLDGTSYDTLMNFNSTNIKYSYDALISDGTYLYGMTNEGGTNSGGVVFKIKPDGTSFDTLINFNSSIGSLPFGSLITDGTYLYGMTYSGGTNNAGVIFKYCLTNSCTTSITQINNQNTEIKIYPNPSADILNIETNFNGTVHQELKIEDVLGNEIFKQVLSSQYSTISIANLQNGIYFIRVGNSIQKFIVQH